MTTIVLLFLADLVLLWQCRVEHWQCHVPFPPPQQSQDKLYSFSISISPPLSIHFYLSSIPSVLSALHGVCSKKKKQCSPASCYQHRSALSHTIISSRNSTRIGIWVLARCMLHSCIKKFLMPEVSLSASSGVSFCGVWGSLSHSDSVLVW